MAKSTYLQLCNDILTELNEVTISTVTGNRGLQSYVVNSVNTAIHDICSKEPEWPFNRTAGTQTLTAGTAEYSLPTSYMSVDYESFFLRPTNLITNGTFDSAITSWTDISTGTGAASAASARMRLNGGASGVAQATQLISTIGNLPHKIKFQIFSGSITLGIGTTSGGTELLSQSCTIDNPGNGTYYVVSFTPTTASTYISFSNSANADYDVDNVEVVMDFNVTNLKRKNLEVWRDSERQLDFFADKSRLGYPTNVVFSQADSFILTPAPLYSNMYVSFDYWAPPTQLASDSDTSVIPERFEKAITQYVSMLVHKFKSDAARSSDFKKEYDMTIADMRRDLINKNWDMVAV